MASFLVFTCVLSLAFAQRNFAPFGTNAGDTMMPTGTGTDLKAGPIPFELVFYGHNYSQIWVHNEGFLGMINQEGAISPFAHGIDTRGVGSGRVYYRSTTDAALLSTWSAKVSSTFNGNRAFIATWDRVGYFPFKVDKLNSFQVVVIADAIGNSWCFFNYDRLEWVYSAGSSIGFFGPERFIKTPEAYTPAANQTTDFLTRINPPVIVLPPRQTCGNGIVEGTEQCDGGSCCSNCAFSAASTVCRASAGACDVAETCSGSSSACPADAVAPTTQVCRPAANGCDIADSCDGVSSACPVDRLSMSAPCFCGRRNVTEPRNAPEYFCSPTGDLSVFYQCVYGAFLPQSSTMRCSQGTTCGCPAGNECSCNASQSPCVWANTLQQC